MSNLGIYIHIPFCQSKCAYCNFVSFNQTDEFCQKYFSALEAEISASGSCDREITSIFIGGGTPSCVKVEYIENLLSLLRRKFKLKQNCEVTIECNPNSVSLEKLTRYKNAGVNRVSFGVQSFDNGLLKKIGRIHNEKQIFEAIENAQKAGIKNINIDLLLSLKHDEKKLAQNLEKIKQIGVTHVSAYMLILEENTPLYSAQDKSFLLSEDASVEQYERVAKMLIDLGFNRYEISNFALLGYECRHNLNYWDCGEYLAFGLSAHEYYNDIRKANTNALNEYCNKQFKYETEYINKQQKIEELIMLSLRTARGLPLKKLKELGLDILKQKDKEINDLKSKNIININDDFIQVNSEYIGVTNQIILRLI